MKEHWQGNQNPHEHTNRAHLRTISRFYVPYESEAAHDGTQNLHRKL